MSTYKQLDKEFSHLSDMVGLLRTQAFNLALSSSQGQEKIAEAQLNDLSNQLLDINKYVKDIKRWASEIKDGTTI